MPLLYATLAERAFDNQVLADIENLAEHRNRHFFCAHVMKHVQQQANVISMAVLAS